MRKIILGAIPEDFDPERDIPLGPFCFLDREDVYLEWQSLPFQPDPFTTPEAIAEASQLTSVYANSLIPRLAEELNNLNGTRHSNRFWRLMIFPWLLSVIQAVWERQARLLQFIDEYGKTQLHVDLIPVEIQWRFNNTVDFLNRGILNPKYNEWLFSRILEQNKPDEWELGYKTVSLDGFEEPEHISGKKAEKRGVKQIILDRFWDRRCVGVYGIGILESLIWSTYLDVKPIRYEKVVDADNNEFRSEVTFNVNVINIILECLPECFSNLELLNVPKPSPKPGRIRLIGPVLYYEEQRKYFLGLCLDGGEKLVVVQHGGVCGRGKVYPFGSEVEYKQYRFFSWGWTEQENYAGNIKPMPSPFLSNFIGKRRQKGTKLLLIGTIARFYPLRIYSFPQALQNLKYRKSKVDFLKNLNKDVFEHIEYRPYMNDHGALKDLSYIQKIFPTISICYGKLHPKLLKCKLAVLDHPGTTYTISMVANVPTIGFWNEHHWAASKQARSIFETLRKKEMVFNNGIDAARKTNEIWDDISSWWNHSEIQSARKEFCERYAYTRKQWRWTWLKELWRL